MRDPIGLVPRRRALRLGSGALLTGLGAPALVRADEREGHDRAPDHAGPPDGLGPKHAGPNRDHIVIDYDDYDDPDEIYNVNDNRSGIPPRFVATAGGEHVLETEFSSNAKTANIEYRFPEHPDHAGLNDHDMPDELYVRFRLYPADIELSEFTTVRFFWLPLTNGPGSSGGGQPDGTNGWSNAIGFSHRNDSPAPDGYHFFSYTYHLDGSGDFEMTDVPVWMDQWNTIEGYVRCNTVEDGVANNDGVMRYWVNGELAYSRTNFAMTTSEANVIEGTGPLGYVVGDDLSGNKLLYDDHEIAIGYNPGRVDEDADDGDDGDDGPGTTYQFRDLLEEASTDYRDDFDVAIQLEANEPGEWWTFSFDAPSPGRYELGIEALFTLSYGIYDLSINGEPVETIDFYSPSGVQDTVWYERDLDRHDNTITFENVGKHEDSSNYKMALYYLTLLEAET